jgi:O-antigen/teichoic acid export membrane protein
LTTIKQLVSGISESILPYIIKFKALDSTYAFDRSLRYSWKYTNIILFPLVFALSILARPGIEFIVGKNYLPSAGLIFLLLPSVVFYSWVTVQQNRLFAEGKALHLFWINLIGFLVFFACSAILIKRFGVNGSVLSVLAGSSTCFLLTSAYSVRRKDVSYYFGGPMFRPLIASLIMAGWLGLFEISSIWRLFGIGISGIAVYAAVMLLIKGITLDDLNRIYEALFVPSQ